MRPRSRECDYLSGDALSLEHALAKYDVPVTCNGDVVIAGVVQARIAFGINRYPDDAVAAAKRVEILGRVKVIVNVDQVGQLARR